MLTCQTNGDTLVLAGKLQVHFLDGIHDCLLAALKQPQALKVDVSAVEEVDVAGLQLLLSFLNTRQASQPTRLAGVPPVLGKALKLSGLEGNFTAFTDLNH